MEFKIIIKRLLNGYGQFITMKLSRTARKIYEARNITERKKGRSRRKKLQQIAEVEKKGQEVWKK